MGSNKDNLESMTEQQVKQVLIDKLADKAVWSKVYSGLFGNEVTAENPKVKYMRSITNHAGPIREGTKRYLNIKDEVKK